jgi:hypothetical protein
MYTPQQASKLRSDFWASFGHYMRPLPGANGETKNWLNYKTGVKHLYFRMDADQHHAGIAIEIRSPDTKQRVELYNKLEALSSIFTDTAGKGWTWEKAVMDHDGQEMSRIIQVIQDVNVYNKADWPAIISFLKPKMLDLDRFWDLVRENF